MTAPARWPNQGTDAEAKADAICKLAVVLFKTSPTSSHNRVRAYIGAELRKAFEEAA